MYYDDNLIRKLAWRKMHAESRSKYNSFIKTPISTVYINEWMFIVKDEAYKFTSGLK